MEHSEFVAALTDAIDTHTPKLTQEDRDQLYTHLVDTASTYKANKPGTDLLVWSPLNDHDRRVEIESKLTALNISDYLRTGTVKQTVATSPGVKVTFRSLTPLDRGFLEMWRRRDLKRADTDEAKTDKDADVLSLISSTQPMEWLSQLVLAIDGVNDTEFKSVYELKGSVRLPNMDLCNARRLELASYGEVLIWDFFINYLWFEDRVRQLHTPKTIQSF